MRWRKRHDSLPRTSDNTRIGSRKVLSGRHAFVSYLNPQQLEIAIEACQSFAVDNGAFSAWKSGRVMNWPDYFDWVESIKRLPGFDFAVIPDVIDGDELQNNELIDAWPHEPWLSAPVWHMHESIQRLQVLARNWPRVCIGSSGRFATVGDSKWWHHLLPPDVRPVLQNRPRVVAPVPGRVRGRRREGGDGGGSPSVAGMG